MFIMWHKAGQSGPSLLPKTRYFVVVLLLSTSDYFLQLAAKFNKILTIFHNYSFCVRSETK